MQTNKINQKDKESMSELGYFVYFHKYILIGKNILNFVLANARQFDERSEMRYVVTKTIVTIVTVNIVIFCGFLHALLNLDVTSYDLINKSGQYLILMAICTGFHLFVVYLIKDIYINYVFVVLLLFIVGFELIVVDKTCKLLGPISLKKFTRFTSDAKIIDAWKRRLCIKTIRIVYFGFYIIYFFREIITPLLMPNLSDEIIECVSYRQIFLVRIMQSSSFIFGIGILALLSFNLDNESKTQRQIIIVLNTILIVFASINNIYAHLAHGPLCVDYSFIDIFYLLFLINAQIQFINEYKIVGIGLKDFFAGITVKDLQKL